MTQDLLRMKQVETALAHKVQSQIAHNLTDSEKWTTGSEIPDPPVDKLPKPAGFRLLIRPLPSKDKTEGGVWLPQQVMDNQLILQVFAKVLAIGPLCWNRSDYTVEGGWCQVGDIIMVPRHVGSAIEVEGVKCKIIDDETVMAVIPDINSVKRG